MVWRWVKAIRDQYFPSGPAPDRQVWVRKEGNRTVIVLVHGFSGDAIATWPHFGRLLADSRSLAGWDVASLSYGTSFLPDFEGLWRADASIALLARGLSTDCSHGELADYPNIVFVAHSMGGLVVQRALVDRLELAQKTRHLFMFGTPSNGLIKAQPVGGVKPQLADMMHGGEFIRDLRARWTAQFGARPPFKIFAIAGENDQFVPAERSLPPFAEHQQFSVPGDHLQIVKAQKESDAGVQLVIRGIRGDAAPTGLWNAARVAVELGEFKKTIANFGDPAGWPGLDADAKVALALALESDERGEEAFQLLANSAQQAPDIMGTLAGRLKRRWLLKRQADDAARARGYYETAYDDAAKIASAARREEQRYYHAINVAFMLLAMEQDREGAAAWADKAVVHCAAAPDSMWKSATLADAELLNGRDEAALQHYKSALDQKPEPRQISSIYLQAAKIADLLGRQETKRKLEALFRPDI
jgi:pimeloyl-ACP methyl ester carboxylesterase